MAVVASNRNSMDLTQLSADTHNLLKAISAQSTAGVPDVYREQVATRMKQLKVELRLLAACYNAGAPISQLPAELMAKIFLVVKESSDAASTQWLWTTHVCQSWRNIALDCANLWIRPLFIPSKPDLAMAMAGRSKGAFLEIDCDAAVPCGGALEEAIMCLHRVKSLSVRGDPMVGVPTSRLLDWSGDSGPTPHLEKLSLEFIFRHAEGSHPTPPLLPMRTSPLRLLEIRHCGGIRWSQLPMATTLTKLQLVELRVNTLDHRPTGEELLSSFRGMAELQDLELVGYLPTEDFRTDDPITLPKLRSLRLEDSSGSINPFFRSIHLPHTTTIHLCFHHIHRDAPVSPFVDVFASVRDSLTTPSGPYDHPGVHSLSIESYDSAPVSKRPQFTLWCNDESKDRSLDHNLQLSFYNRPLHEFTTALGAIARVFSLSPLTSLSVDDTNALREEVYDIFDTLPNLHSVEFKSSTVGAFISALQGYTSTDTTSSGSVGEEVVDPSPTSIVARAPFPALKTLTFNNPLFGGPHACDFVEQMPKVLKARKTSGHSLSTFTIEGAPRFDLLSYLRLRGASPDTEISWDLLPQHTNLSDYDDWVDPEDKEEEVVGSVE